MLFEPHRFWLELDEASLLAQLVCYDLSEICGFLLVINPFRGLIIVQQCRGFEEVIPPSTIEPAKEKQIIEVVESGKATFEVGQAIKAQLR